MKTALPTPPKNTSSTKSTSTIIPALDPFAFVCAIDGRGARERGGAIAGGAAERIGGCCGGAEICGGA